MTHGLTQPATSDKSGSVEEPSGYGYELAFVTIERADWAAVALGQLLTYLRQRGMPIDRGHRVPMWFSIDADQLRANVGKPPKELEGNTVSEMISIVFWPYMKYPEGFTTSTGYFTVLVGTTITQLEWNMAKATSSAHLLCLLFKAGIGQVSDLQRPSVTRDARWQAEWERLRLLSEVEVNELLVELA